MRLLLLLFILRKEKEGGDVSAGHLAHAPLLKNLLLP